LVEVIARLRISDELYTRTYNEKIFFVALVFLHTERNNGKFT